MSNINLLPWRLARAQRQKKQFGIMIGLFLAATASLAFAVDWLVQPGSPPQRFSSPRIDTPHTHGTGCTLSAAIAALRPQSADLPSAVAAAKHYLYGALHEGQHWQLGHGHGPLAHFWRFFGQHGEP